VRAKPEAMTELQASRTLVKSPPELWAECSDAAALARHLGGFGEIRITRLDPETAVAWEGEKVRGTVRIEPAGWGTKVILTAEQAVEPAAPVEDVAPVVPQEPEPPGEPEPLPSQPPEPDPEPIRRRRFARLRGFFRGGEPVESPSVATAAEPEPEPVEPGPVEPRPVEPEPVVPVEPGDAEASESAAGDTEAALTAALDSLGQAHHRPYSRA
jgi:hypothetical protein